MKKKVEENGDNTDFDGNAGGSSGTDSGGNPTGTTDSLGASADNPSTSGSGSDGHRSESGSGNADNPSTSGDNRESNESDSGTTPNLVRESGQSANDGANVSDNRSRGRGRPRGSGRNRTQSTNSTDSRAGSQTQKPLGFDFLDEGEPSTVNGLFDSDDVNFKKFGKTERQRFLGMVLAGIFKIPAGFLKKPYWELTAQETKDLAEAVNDYLDSLPKSQAKKLEKFLKDYAPIIALGTATYLIVYPRLSYEFELARKKRAGIASGNAKNERTGSSEVLDNEGFERDRARATGKNDPENVQTYFERLVS